MKKYIRKGRKYMPEEFLQYVEIGQHKHVDKVVMDGDEIKLGSDRYECFKFKGLRCVTCGIVGTYFVKEMCASQKHESYHMNLYGTDPSGREVLMTKDHILPKSRGGLNHISNYQTMCTHCNSDKGNRLETEKF